MAKPRLHHTSRTTAKAPHAYAPAFVSPRVAAAVVNRLEDVTSVLDYDECRLGRTWQSSDIGLAAGPGRAD